MTRKTRKKGCFSGSTVILENRDTGSKSVHFQEKEFFFVSKSVIFVYYNPWNKENEIKSSDKGRFFKKKKKGQISA